MKPKRREAKKLIASAKDGIDLGRLPIGTIVEARTKNSLYKIKKLENGEHEIEGGKHFPEPCINGINGSTWGGSMIKMNWLGIGMHIEFTNGPTTSPVQSLKIIAPDASWEYQF
jgi:hypothetical protein